MSLPPLPGQPNDVPWPTQRWPVAGPPPGVDRVRLAQTIDTTLAEPQPASTAQTNELLIVHRGRIVAERYAAGLGPKVVQLSWSMAKSIVGLQSAHLARNRI